MRKTTLIFIIFFVISQACFGVEIEPLSFSYSGGTGGGKSMSDYSENEWDYTYQYHVIGAAGDTLMGKLDSRLQVEEGNGYKQLSYMKMGLSGKNYSLDLGDNNTSFSELTLKSMSYQGAGLTLKPSKNFILMMVGGSRGNSYWGKEVRRDTRQEENFSGLRTTYYPVTNFGINATYLTMGDGKDLVAYGGQYSFGDMSFFTECGLAGEGKGFVGEAKYNGGNFRLSTTYRDIDTSYSNPVDYVSYVGKKGTYSTATYSPIKDLTISGRYDYYTDNLANDPSISNADMSADMSYYLTSSTLVYLSDWVNDRKSYDRGGVSKGGYWSLSQAFDFLTNNTVYVKGQPSKFESSSSSEESYTEDKNIIGLNVSLFDIASFNMESEQGKKDYISTGVEVNPSAVELRFDLNETRFIFDQIFLSGSVDFRKDIAGTSDDDETSSTYSDITLRYKPNRDFSCYVSGAVSNVQGPDEDRTTANQTHIRFGLNYAFTSGMYMKADNDIVEGFVFADENGNGTKEDSEHGICGVMVLAGSRVGITDSKGYYRISVSGGDTAGIDLSALPDGYICTTASDQSISAAEDGKINFGLIKKTSADNPSQNDVTKVSSIK